MCHFCHGASQELVLLSDTFAFSSVFSYETHFTYIPTYLSCLPCSYAGFFESVLWHLRACLLRSALESFLGLVFILPPPFFSLSLRLASFIQFSFGGKTPRHDFLYEEDLSRWKETVRLLTVMARYESTESSQRNVLL